MVRDRCHTGCEYRSPIVGIIDYHLDPAENGHITEAYCRTQEYNKDYYDIEILLCSPGREPRYENEPVNDNTTNTNNEPIKSC